MGIRIGYYPIHIRVTYPHASHALATRARSLAPSPEHASSDVHALATRARARQAPHPHHPLTRTRTPACKSTALHTDPNSPLRMQASP